MSVLSVVRHGQASFFADEYDKLSEIGVRQARHLGEHWVKQQVTFDEVYAGPRVRQQDSAHHVGSVFRQSGLDWPEPEILNDLDEYDLRGLAGQLAPQLASVNADFAQLVGSYKASNGEQNRMREFQRMFESLLRYWQANDLTGIDVESWNSFQQRVQRAIREIQNRPGRSRRVAVFTSGGFIGTAVQQAMHASDSMALELNWRVRNCSITEFVFTPERLSLDTFNTIPHLHDPELWTHR